MNFRNLTDETRERILTFTITGILVVLFYFLLKNFGTLWAFINKILGALSPFIIGAIFAFIFIPLRRKIENGWFKNLNFKPGTKRKLAVLICVVIMIIALVAFFWILIPQLADSISLFAASFDGYVETASNWIEQLNNADSKYVEMFKSMIDSAGEKVTAWLTGESGGLIAIFSYSVSLAMGIMNFFMGLIIFIYILLDEEKIRRQFRSMLYAACSKDFADKVMKVVKLTSDTFSSFLFGKFLDSLIIGIITYIVVVIMKLPYAPLIAVVIGVTNMIPVFGPFLGAVPCTLILLIIDFWMAVEFVIFAIILQQIDGNIIGPRILGKSVGLPQIWVMFALLMGGALFGFVGMLVGVPCFSVIYTLVGEAVEKSLKKKNIDIDNINAS